jgi:hypothetical protein
VTTSHDDGNASISRKVVFYRIMDDGLFQKPKSPEYAWYVYRNFIVRFVVVAYDKEGNVVLFPSLLRLLSTCPNH